MDQVTAILKMLLNVLMQLLELFVGFMISALNLVLQFAHSVAGMVR